MFTRQSSASLEKYAKTCSERLLVISQQIRMSYTVLPRCAVTAGSALRYSATDSLARPLNTIKATFPMTHRVLRNLLFVSTVLGFASGLSFPSLALAQDSMKPTPELLMERMTGKWVMRGTIANEKVMKSHVKRTPPVGLYMKHGFTSHGTKRTGNMWSCGWTILVLPIFLPTA
jgi:hypothetical protein